MERETVLRVLAAHRDELRRRFGVRSLAVFGSVARGEAHPGSDVDILVDFLGRGTFDAYMDLKFFLEDLLGCQVDLVTRKALKPRWRHRIEAEAIEVRSKPTRRATSTV